MKQKTQTYLVVFLLLLIGADLSGGWRRRRRRRCPVAHCRWGSWGSWGSCTAPCGNSGTRTRTRGVAQHAQCGGSGCSGPSSETEACNRFCHNGGTPFASHCACQDHFWNTCCQSACTPISHCSSLSCTQHSNQRCQRCEGDYGSLGQAYSNLGTSCRQACSWREDSNSCYPGTCPAGVQSCTCAPGFGGPHCRTIQQTPAFQDCSYEITGNNGVTTIQGSCSQSDKDGDAAYTNMPQVEHISIRWTSAFQPAPLPTQPVYVRSTTVGITGGSIDVSLRNETVTAASTTTTCTAPASAEHPEEGVFTCEEDITLGWTALHGQGLEIHLKATAGGNVQLFDRDSSSAVKVKYFTGSHGNHRADIVFDFEPPRHCSLMSQCDDAMLDIGSSVTDRGYLVIRWSGWEDEIAGIRSYQYSIYKLVRTGDNFLTEVSQPTMTEEHPADSSGPELPVHLDEPGVYSVILTVTDRAGNSQKARRIVLFDHISSIDTNATHPLGIEEASKQGGVLWAHDSKVTVNWRGHFFNSRHNNNGWLLPVKEVAGVDQAYDHTEGVRSTQQVINVQGIVNFQVAHAAFPGGVRGEWTAVEDVLLQSQQLSLLYPDGDAAQVWIKAQDVVGTEATDSIIIHFDTSAPAVTNMSLRTVHEDMYVDGVIIRVDMEAMDVHSGVVEVAWSLYEKISGQQISEGQFEVQPTDECADADDTCYCIPVGSCFPSYHSFRLNACDFTIERGQEDYYVHLTAINGADLRTTVSVQVEAFNSLPDATEVPPPSHVSVEDITDTTATVTWMTKAACLEPTLTFVEYSLQGEATQVQFVAVGGTMAELSDLTPGQLYSVQVVNVYGQVQHRSSTAELHTVGDSAPTPGPSTGTPWYIYAGLGAGGFVFLIIMVTICYCCRRNKSDPGQPPFPNLQNTYGNEAYCPDGGDGPNVYEDCDYLAPYRQYVNVPPKTSEKGHVYQSRHNQTR